MKKLIIKKEIRTLQPYDIDDKLSDLISELQDIVDTYGESCIIEAEKEYDYYGECDYYKFVISYFVEESDEDFKKRQEKNRKNMESKKRSAEKRKLTVEQKERKEFERLKKKFE